MQDPYKEKKVDSDNDNDNDSESPPTLAEIQAFNESNKKYYQQIKAYYFDIETFKAKIDIEYFIKNISKFIAHPNEFFLYRPHPNPIEDDKKTYFSSLTECACPEFVRSHQEIRSIIENNILKFVTATYAGELNNFILRGLSFGSGGLLQDLVLLTKLIHEGYYKSIVWDLVDWSWGNDINNLKINIETNGNMSYDWPFLDNPMGKISSISSDISTFLGGPPVFDPSLRKNKSIQDFSIYLQALAKHYQVKLELNFFKHFYQHSFSNQFYHIITAIDVGVKEGPQSKKLFLDLRKRLAPEGKLFVSYALEKGIFNEEYSHLPSAISPVSISPASAFFTLSKPSTYIEKDFYFIIIKFIVNEINNERAERTYTPLPSAFEKKIEKYLETIFHSVKLTNTQKIISERVKNLSQNDCNTVFSSTFDNKFIIKYFSYFLDSDFEGSKIIETIWKNFESSKQCNRRNNHIFVNSYLILARQATTSELKLLLDESEFPPFEPLTTLFKLDDKAECYHTYVNFLQKQMELLNNSTYSCH